MATKAKNFEQRFKQDWMTYCPDSFCYRLNDQVSGYKGTSANISDFLCYKYPLDYVIDCKTHKGNTISFSDFSQYERMLPYKDIKGMVLGTVIWFYEKDKIVWCPIQTWEKLKLEGKKSFNLKYIDDPNYDCFEIPSRKLRTYMETNYSYLTDVYEREYNEID